MNKITADNYFCIIPEWVLYAPISALAVRLYGTLQRYADKDSGACHPARKTLAMKCQTTTKSIDRALRELVELGAIEMHQRRNTNGDLTSNQYTVITASGVGTKSPLPRDKNGTRGRDKNDPETIVSMNHSQEPSAATADTDGWWADEIADEWMTHYSQRTGGKTPTGKNAAYSLRALIRGALLAGWSVDAVRNALTQCDAVPSAAQIDRILVKQGKMKPAQPVPVKHPADCAKCEGVGFITFVDHNGNRSAYHCDESHI